MSRDADTGPTVTVFTPTYERADTLHRPYESLLEQSYDDFEWLVVDDDSEDGTAELVEKWRAEADFPIRLHVQGEDERGKHRAHNRALELARGEFFVTLDSDDELLPEALEGLLDVWASIPEAERDEFVGVAATRAVAEESGRGRLPTSPYDGGWAELHYVHGRRGETVELSRTAVLREYPYPDIDGVRYVPESTVESRINRRYRRRYVDEVFARYDADSGADQLTRAATLRDSPAFAYWHAVRLNEHTEWFRDAPRPFLVSAVGFVRHSLHAGDGPRAQFGRLSTPLARLLWVFAILPGVLVYLRDRWRGAE